jgi:molecular chaperone GrpE (heat shock protein)
MSRAAPLPTKHILNSDLDNPVHFAGDGTATLIGMIEDLKMDLDKANKKSVSEQKKILLNILEIADSLDSIIETLDLRISEGEIHLKKVTDNFRSLRRKVDQALRNSNVHTINTPDGIANLGTHEIFETRFRPDMVEFTIIEEIKKGYIWNGQILREALVIVAMKHSAEQLKMR